MTTGQEAPSTILVVEDDADIVEAMQIVLEPSGCAVLTAANGREAMEILDRQGPVSLVFLDLMMPVADGWWFLAELARRPALAGIPVVILTGAWVTKEEAAALPVAGFLRKPVALNDILSTVELHCSPR